jgi:hypothetical protein
MTEELGKELKSIHPYGAVVTPTVVKDSLALLQGPPLFRIAERKKNEEAITRALKNELGDSAFTPAEATQSLFPSGTPMPFDAAPGSSWSGHHVYPGGLVFHTFNILKLGQSIGDVYAHTYGLKTDRDLLRLAAIWHDAAKTWTLRWNEDGTCTKNEGTIAGTGAHHVWAIAEVLYRGYAPELAVAIAGAHDPLMEGNPGYEKVVNYLRAAAILAGKPIESAGLERSANGVALKGHPPLAPLITHMGDGDWPLTVQAMQIARPLVEKSLAGKVAPADLHWEVSRRFAENGELPLYTTDLGPTESGHTR